MQKVLDKKDIKIYTNDGFPTSLENKGLFETDTWMLWYIGYKDVCCLDDKYYIIKNLGSRELIQVTIEIYNYLVKMGEKIFEDRFYNFEEDD